MNAYIAARVERQPRMRWPCPAAPHGDALSASITIQSNVPNLARIDVTMLPTPGAILPIVLKAVESDDLVPVALVSGAWYLLRKEHKQGGARDDKIQAAAFIKVIKLPL